MTKSFLFLVASLLCMSTLMSQNLNVRAYNFPGFEADYSVLDNVFGTVTANGAVVTADATTPQTITSLPSTVAGYTGTQMVILVHYGNNITTAQFNALVDFVKAGGIVFSSLEATTVNNGARFNKLFGEALLCNSVTISSSAGGSPGISPGVAYHPGDGLLDLNMGGANTVYSTSSYSQTTGVPSENAIMLGQSTTSTPCSNVDVLDFIAPAYPGIQGGNNTCNVNGFAIISGDIYGPMSASYSFSNPNNQGRNNSALNQNYAQLAYDFLYNSTAMYNRNSWTQTSANTNATCPPAPPCFAGSDAPSLSSTSLANTCPETTVNLATSTTASNTPSAPSVSLTWHSGTNATNVNKLTPAQVASASDGTYYAAFYDSSNICYSPSTLVTVTITSCTDPCTIGTTPGTPTANDPDADGINNECDLDDDNDGILDIDECALSSFDLPFTTSAGSGLSYAANNITFLPSAGGSGFSNSAHSLTFDNYSTLTKDYTLSFTCTTTSGYYFVGLNETNSTASHADISYALYFSGTNLRIYEEGSYTGNFTSIVAGDVCSIQKTGTTIIYKKNGTTIYTSTVPASNLVDYFVDTSFYRDNRPSYDVNDFTLTFDLPPCDSDSDGLYDDLDLDSDNDGCPDALEGGASFTIYNLNVDKSLSGTVDTVPASASYGVPLAAGTGQSVGTSKDDTQHSGCPTTVITNRRITTRVKKN